MNKTAAIFDLDGTLLDSMPMWRDLNRNFLQQNNLPVRQDLFRETEHLPFAECAAVFARAYPELNQTGETLHRTLSDIVMTHYRTKIRPMPGALEYLTYLQAQKIPMAIATLTDRDHVLAALDAHNMTHFFQKILTVTECGQNKTNPAIYQQCARQLGANIADTTVYEDAAYAAKTAHQAGFKVIGLAANETARRALAPYTDRTITDYRELLVRR